MTLEDFEKSLAEEKAERERSQRKHKDREHRHHHHHRSHHRDREDGHHYKRRRRSEDDDDDEEEHRRKRRSPELNDEDDRRRHKHRHGSRERHRSHKEKSRKSKGTGLSDSDAAANADRPAPLKRDSWMEAPSATDIEFVHKKTENLVEIGRRKDLKEEFEENLHEREVKRQLEEAADEEVKDAVVEEPAQHEVDYIFGDAGSKWRMKKLKNVYRQAKESSESIEKVALRQYADLRSFDDAREEEIELERRETYGEGYVGKEKPSGDLFQERKLDMGIHRDTMESQDEQPEAEIKAIDTKEPPRKTAVDLTTLNRMRAKMMRAKLRDAPEATQLEAEYNAAAAGALPTNEPGVVVLGTMENRMLAGGRGSEIKNIDNKRGRERGHVEENEDMSIEDMIREERRTRGQAGGEGLRLAERIAKDEKFDNDLEYMDENAAKLAKRVHRSEINLKNTAVADFQKMNRILDNCPLCHHEDTSTPPLAPVISLATRVYLTLPTEPELAKCGACIVPIQHRTNLLECDDDEWEEIRNFMKSLTRFYATIRRIPLFYENTARPGQRRHAALLAIPLPAHTHEQSRAFFREAILSSAPEWSQHKKLIDTQKNAEEKGMGRLAFRRSIAKEAPYFHVWFTIDGGLGHVVEDEEAWPRGDLFAREVLGGMLRLGSEVWRRQGHWVRGDQRVGEFRKIWAKFDWTASLVEEGGA